MATFGRWFMTTNTSLSIIPIGKMLFALLMTYVSTLGGINVIAYRDVTSYDNCLCSKLFDILVDEKARWKDNMQNVAQLEKKVKKLEMHKSTWQRPKGPSCTHPIAFYARRKPVKVVAAGKTVDYENVITDTCNTFNRNTSVFTCPYPGVYVFHFFVLDNANGRTTYLELVKNGDVMAFTWSRGHNGYHEMAGNTAILNLMKGDKVYVRAGKNNPVEPHGDYCTFSGFMIY